MENYADAPIKINVETEREGRLMLSVYRKEDEKNNHRRSRSSHKEPVLRVSIPGPTESRFFKKEKVI